MLLPGLAAEICRYPGPAPTVRERVPERGEDRQAVPLIARPPALSTQAGGLSLVSRCLVAPRRPRAIPNLNRTIRLRFVGYAIICGFRLVSVLGSHHIAAGHPRHGDSRPVRKKVMETSGSRNHPHDQFR